MNMTNLIPETTINELREQIIFRRVEVILKDGSSICGICSFFGYNSYLPSYGYK